MALRRTSRGPIRQAPRRVNKWSVGPRAQEVRLINTGNQLWTDGVVLTKETQVTLVRIRGDAIIYLATAAAVDDGYHGAFGIGLCTQEAFSAGAGSVPNPNSDDESEWDGWIYHRFFHVFSPLVGITAGAQQTAAPSIYQRFEIDSKAMRKWSDGFVLFGALGVTEVGVSSAAFSADTRLLVKLP